MPKTIATVEQISGHVAARNDVDVRWERLRPLEVDIRKQAIAEQLSVGADMAGLIADYAVGEQPDAARPEAIEVRVER